MTPQKLWWWSTRLHRRGMTPLAWLLKLANFVLFKAVLPYEVELQPDVRLLHRGLGVVIHPLTRIGSGVTIAHGVTTASKGRPVVIGDGVLLGAGCKILGSQSKPLVVGDGAQIGANAVVVRDVPEGARMAAPEAVARPAQPPAA